MLPNERINPLLVATVSATGEAIVNALVAAETMEGIDGNIVHALPHNRLRVVLRKYGELLIDRIPYMTSERLPSSAFTRLPGGSRCFDIQK